MCVCQPIQLHSFKSNQSHVSDEHDFQRSRPETCNHVHPLAQSPLTEASQRALRRVPAAPGELFGAATLQTLDRIAEANDTMRRFTSFHRAKRYSRFHALKPVNAYLHAASHSSICLSTPHKLTEILKSSFLIVFLIKCPVVFTCVDLEATCAFMKRFQRVGCQPIRNHPEIKDS